MASWTNGMLNRRQKSRELTKSLERSAIEKASNSTDETGLRESERDARINEILTARREKYVLARELMRNPEVTAFVLVLTPEKLPILESKKALDLLERYGMTTSAIVVNRLMPEEAEGEFLETRRRQEAEYRREIKRIFRAIPQYHLPLQSQDVLGAQRLKEVGMILSGNRDET